MIQTYKKYSQYYDMFYTDKNYKAEAEFIIRHLKRFSRKSLSLLSLGCGTCTYELLMAKKGYKIAGIDISLGMLNMAAKKIKKAHLESKISIYHKDVRNFTFGEKFDSAFSMFNVVGYQTKNEEFEAMLKNVSDSLNPGGVFMFDCWHMPAVLKDKPVDKVKEVVDGKSRILRLTKSKLNAEENVIEINFKVLELKNKRLLFETEETHYVRFWSIPELTYFLDKAGFSTLEVCNFMDEKTKVSDNNWNIFVVARKRS